MQKPFLCLNFTCPVLFLNCPFCCQSNALTFIFWGLILNFVVLSWDNLNFPILGFSFQIKPFCFAALLFDKQSMQTSTCKKMRIYLPQPPDPRRGLACVALLGNPFLICAKSVWGLNFARAILVLYLSFLLSVKRFDLHSLTLNFEIPLSCRGKASTSQV